MRADHLHARSVAFEQAGALAGVVCILITVAFARLLDLMVTEEWLAPLLGMMLVQFLGGCMLAHRRRILNRETLTAEVTIKVMMVLAYVAGFIVQRMFDKGPDAPNGAMGSVGHATAGALIAFDFLRFVRTLRAFGLRLGPFEAAVIWFDRTFAAEFRRQEVEQVACNVAKAERHAAVEEYRDTGEISRQPAVTTSNVCPPPDSDPSIDAQDKF